MPPDDTAPGPDSNCGLTRSTAQAPSAARARAGPIAWRRLMKLKSAVTTCGRSGICAGPKLARVHAFQRHDFIVFQKLWVQLPMANIDAVNPPGTAFEQNFRKSPGRGADIQADAIRGRQCKSIERRGQLHATA